jgi:hypothetical protein
MTAPLFIQQTRLAALCGHNDAVKYAHPYWKMVLYEFGIKH